MMNEGYNFEEHVAEVLSRYADTPDERLREIMRSVTRHLLSFANEVQLSRTEWMAGQRQSDPVGLWRRRGEIR